MDEAKRGGLLTTLAILFALVAIEDLLKPFKLEGPETGLVFFGTRQTGLANAILGSALGFVLLAYAAGIWRLHGSARDEPHHCLALRDVVRAAGRARIGPQTERCVSLADA